jgi:hypothetical protein
MVAIFVSNGTLSCLPPFVNLKILIKTMKNIKTTKSKQKYPIKKTE